MAIPRRTGSTAAYPFLKSPRDGGGSDDNALGDSIKGKGLGWIRCSLSETDESTTRNGVSVVDRAHTTALKALAPSLLGMGSGGVLA